MKGLTEVYQGHVHGTYFAKRRWIIDNQITTIDSDCGKCYTEKKKGSCVTVNPGSDVI